MEGGGVIKVRPRSRFRPLGGPGRKTSLEVSWFSKLETNGVSVKYVESNWILWMTLFWKCWCTCTQFTPVATAFTSKRIQDWAAGKVNLSVSNTLMIRTNGRRSQVLPYRTMSQISNDASHRYTIQYTTQLSAGIQTYINFTRAKFRLN